MYTLILDVFSYVRYSQLQSAILLQTTNVTSDSVERGKQKKIKKKN